jgi:membrane protein required for colicin V production
MNGVDYLILGVLAFSMLLGMLRGFVREAIGLMAWLGGMWLAWRYAPLLEPYLGGMLGHAPVRTWAARVLIVIAVLVIGWIVAGLLAYFLRQSGLSLVVDRLLGLFFGVLRGAVVVSIFVLLGQFVELQGTPWWKQSRLLPYMSECAGWIQTFAETGMQMFEKRSLALPNSSSSVRS